MVCSLLDALCVAPQLPRIPGTFPCGSARCQPRQVPCPSQLSISECTAYPHRTVPHFATPGVPCNHPPSLGTKAQSVSNQTVPRPLRDSHVPQPQPDAVPVRFGLPRQHSLGSDESPRSCSIFKTEPLYREPFGALDPVPPMDLVPPQHRCPSKPLKILRRPAPQQRRSSMTLGTVSASRDLSRAGVRRPFPQAQKLRQPALVVRQAVLCRRFPESMELVPPTLVLPQELACCCCHKRLKLVPPSLVVPQAPTYRRPPSELLNPLPPSLVLPPQPPPAGKKRKGMEGYGRARTQESIPGPAQPSLSAALQHRTNDGAPPMPPSKRPCISVGCGGLSSRSGYPCSSGIAATASVPVAHAHADPAPLSLKELFLGALADFPLPPKAASRAPPAEPCKLGFFPSQEARDVSLSALLLREHEPLAAWVHHAANS
jgi:hypothetical protein